MRKELKLIRESIDRERKDRIYLPTHHGKKEKIHEKREYPMMPQDTRRCPSTPSDDGPVMRPPLKRKSTPIPNSNLQPKRVTNMNREKAQESRKKPDIRVISNIQIKPPKEEATTLDRIKERAAEEEVTDMEWEENGLDWNEEVERERKMQEERNTQVGGNTQEERNIQETSVEPHGRQEETWSTIIRKGKREDKRKKEKGEAPVRKQNSSRGEKEDAKNRRSQY